jgi:hypothetical protein
MSEAELYELVERVVEAHKLAERAKSTMKEAEQAFVKANDAEQKLMADAKERIPVGYTFVVGDIVLSNSGGNVPITLTKAIVAPPPKPIPVEPPSGLAKAIPNGVRGIRDNPAVQAR